MQYGRIELFTDAPVIDETNIIGILREAYAEHQKNLTKYEYLLDYESGIQPLQRTKTYRSDINCECVDNMANEVTEFNLGYQWANPITLVQRGEVKDDTVAINTLNECYELQNIRSKQQKLGRFVEICGVGYTYVDVADKNSDTPFMIEALDPRFTFVVRSSYYIDRRVMLGVTYRVSSDGNRYFTCFTDTTRFEVRNVRTVINGKKRTRSREDRWEEADRSGERNPLGIVPIVEWFKGYDRMGCFERQISEMDNLNLLISDFTNDVDQNTQAIWHCNDVDFPKDEEGNVIKPKTNDWMQTYTTGEGKTPFVTPLMINYDYQGMLNNIVTRRSLILQKCNVPQRNDNSGGSTGIAMSDATGWSAAESAACKQQAIMESCKLDEIRVVLKAVAISTHESANLLKSLKLSEIQPSIKRQKTYELSVKVNAISTLIAHGFALEDAINVAPLFADPAQVILRSGEGVKKYQEKSVFGDGQEVNEKRPFPDYSDQIDNSPNING